MVKQTVLNFRRAADLQQPAPLPKPASQKIVAQPTSRRRRACHCVCKQSVQQAKCCMTDSLIFRPAVGLQPTPMPKPKPRKYSQAHVAARRRRRACLLVHASNRAKAAQCSVLLTSRSRKNSPRCPSSVVASHCQRIYLHSVNTRAARRTQ